MPQKNNPPTYNTTRGLGSPALYALAALFCIALESVTSFDRFAQTPFFSNGVWLLDRAFHLQWEQLLYTGPKLLIGITGGVFWLVFAVTLYLRKCKARCSVWEKPALLAGLSICLVPLLAASLKAVTGVYSPNDLLPYGGEHPHVGFFEQLLVYGHTAGGRSFPAGHASGGFALMALYYLPLGAAAQKRLLLLGVLAGWLMGLYQMGRGEHFITHTLTTMFLALMFITFMARRLKL